MAAEKRVRVVVADDTERTKSAVPVGSSSTSTGCFGLLQMRAKALRHESRRIAQDGASSRADQVSLARCVEQAVPSTDDRQAAVSQAGISVGSVLAVLDAVNSHETAVLVIDKAAAGERVTMLGFSFDRAEIVQALIRARKRGCLVRVVLDAI